MVHVFRGETSDKLATTRNRCRVCLFSQESSKSTVRVSASSVLLFLAARTSTVATVSKKVPLSLPPSITPSTHNLPFLLSRINKLDRDFLYWQTLSLVCPLRNHVPSLLSHQPLSAFKDGEYRE